MKKLPAILVFILGIAPIARADIPAGWSTNYAAALAEAAGKQEPALVFFTASWCGPCKLMAHVTLADSAVRPSLSEVELVAIDIDEQAGLASKYGIDAVPTFVVLSSAGEEVERGTGFQPPGEFLTWLTNGISGARAAMLRRALFQKELADVDRLLASTNAEAWRQSAAKLFELSADRNEAVAQAAAERLKILASRQPGVLLDGLNDPRLATRIQAANALRLQLGDEFDVDPWSDAVVRAASIRKWRVRFAPNLNN
jgi:thioredoxin-like negative regulator of GroEL